MKRHQVLIPISREHHHMLMLAQLLKKDAPHYPSLPTSLSEKLMYASNEFESMVKAHLERDTLILYPFLGDKKSFRGTAQDLQTRAIDLSENFKRISTLDTDSAHKLAVNLEKYVRIKERVLFQEMQQHLTEDEFIALSIRLGKH